MRPLILRSFQSPGDVVMLTAAVRDLHAGHTGHFRTDVHTSGDVLVKGGTTGHIVGREIVEAYGGRIVRTDAIDGLSTTQLVGRILTGGFVSR